MSGAHGAINGPLDPTRRWRLASGALTSLVLPIALVLVFTTFACISEGFLSGANLRSILVNHFALLAIVAFAMTFAVATGGIDLSLGTAIDFAGFAFVSLILHGQPVWLSALAGLAAGASVGVFNAALISGIGVSPFLATLGSLFVGRSVQQLLTNGGNPVYLPPNLLAEGLRFLGHGTIFALPVPLLLALLVALLSALILGASRFGRILVYAGVQSEILHYSGLRLRWYIAFSYILAALIAALAGLILTSTVTVYIPNSGTAFTLNAIGAAFIGTTLSRLGRANILGSALGVLLLAIVGNGLLLSGLNFYWQQVGTGALILLVLAISFSRRSGAAKGH
jgi:ribose transport system permease protein